MTLSVEVRKKVGIDEMRTQLLDGDDINRPDVGLLCKKTGCDLSERGGDLPVEVGEAAIFDLEGIEDAVLGVVDLEGVPGDGARLGCCQRPARCEAPLPGLASSRASTPSFTVMRFYFRRGSGGQAQ